MLNSALQENLLDDLELLSTLRHAKAVSDSCSERLLEQQKAQAAAEKTLSLYSPVAQRGAKLFEVVQQLESAHPMYLFSVKIVQQCFVDAVLVRQKGSICFAADDPYMRLFL